MNAAFEETGGRAAPPFGPVALTPTALLDRSCAVFGDRLAVVDGDRSFTYRDFSDRCGRLAGALARIGIGAGETVSVLAPNTEMALGATFGVPWAGAVLNALNFRLTADELAYIVDHAGGRVLLADAAFAEKAEAVVAKVPGLHLVVDDGPGSEYEQLLREAEPTRAVTDDELSLLALNYTSGTTGTPKGVMYAHRGAYLQALAMISHAGLTNESVFLWTLPLFHCNGWCFPWAVTGAGGVHVMLRQPDPAAVWELIESRGVTHFNAAPTVLTALAAADDIPVLSGRRIRVGTGGAPPSAALLSRMAEVGIEITHLYGLTETYGPAVICDWRAEWDDLGDDARARMKARQGVANLVGEPVRVIDDDGADVPRDGEHAGEVVLRGNNVMLGYFRDPEATAAAEVDGWFRTGDIGVIHDDGYLELLDRSKDVIISGGENISSIEVEGALASHPAVLECAVVAGPDDYWGEVPVAFVALRADAEASEGQLVEHVKERIASFKAPKQVIFGSFPKTATGKVQKFVLREHLRTGPGAPPPGS